MSRLLQPGTFRSRRRAAGLLEYGVLVALVAVPAVFAVMLTGDRTQRILSSALPPASSAAAPDGSVATSAMAPPEGLGIWSGDGVFVLAPDAGAQSRGFVLTNVGAGPLAVGAPAISGQDAPWFQILASDCPQTLAAGESCGVEILASALSDGEASAFLGAPGTADRIRLVRTAAGFAAFRESAP